MDKAIIHIKVKYDGPSRTLRLAVPAFEALLEPDAIYDLTLPVSMHEEFEVGDLIEADAAVIAHA